MANKSKRFLEQIPENPGPGTYSTEKYTDFRSSKSAPGSLQGKNNAGSVSITSTCTRLSIIFVGSKFHGFIKHIFVYR